MYEALAAWAGDEFRSINGQMEWLLHRALKDAGRLPKPRPGKAPDTEVKKKK